MKLMTHNTVVAAFVLLKDSATDAALKAARAEAGEDAWKKGYSGNTGPTKAARDALTAAGVPMLESLTGKLISAKLAEESDGSGNVYKKLRVALGQEGEDGGVMLSLPADGELAMRLIQKLDKAQPGDMVTLGTFAEPVDRNGRRYYNHCATLKGADDKEITVEGYWARAQDAANAKAKALQDAGLDDVKLINKAKAAAKLSFHLDLLQNSIMPRFAAPH
ncbi:MAG: hypothetical protein ACYC3W_02495 [Candidatus Nanopelagicales bacterium]